MAGPRLYINSAGNLESVDPAKAGEVEALGWVPASPEMVADWNAQQKYGSQPVRAGLEAFGSMLTFGASDWVARGLGVPAEDLAGREKANPMASMLGSAAGIVAPALLTAGTSAGALGAAGAARVGAEVAAPSLIARAGKVVTRAAEKALPEAETLVGRLARKGGAAAAGGAAEGALFEVGHLVHESALGDPGLTAESALAQVGLGAALMGGLAGAGGVLGKLVSELGPSDIGGKLSSWLAKFEGERNLKASGAIQSDIARAGKQTSRESLTAIGREMGELGLVDPFSTPTATLQRADALMAKAGAEMGDILKSADAIAAAERGRLADFGGVLKRVESGALKELEASPLQREAAGRLRKDLSAFSKQFPEGASLEELHGVRRQIDDALYGMRGTLDPYATAYRQALRDFRGEVSAELRAGIEKSGIPGDLWKRANREYEVAARAAEFAEKGMDRLVGNNPLGLSAILGGVAGTVAGGPAGGFASALGVEVARRHASGTAGWMARGLRGLLEGEAGAAVVNRTARQIVEERLAGAATGAAIAQARGVADVETRAALAVLEEAKRAVTKEMDSGQKAILKELPATARRVVVTQATHDDHLDKMGRLMADVGSLQGALASQVTGLTEHAPTVAQVMQIRSAQTAAFLSSKLPPRPPRAPLGTQWKPPKSEQIRLQRVFQVVDKPLKVLQFAKEGTLTPEHVEALKAAWPSLYTHLQSRVLEALVERGGGHLTYRSRMMLAMLMGQDLDGSLLGKAILANQAIYAQPSQKSEAPPPAGGHPEKLSLGARSATPGQASEARRSEGS